MTREEFFAAKNAGALWDVGVSINRTNPLPLDKNAVFDTLENAQAYAEGVLAYPGQFIAVVGETAVDGYLIVKAGTGAELRKLASQTASGDIVSDLNSLATRVSGLETSVGDIKAEIGAKKDGDTAATGIYKYVDDAVSAATPDGYDGVKADVAKLVGTDKGEDGRANKTVREIAKAEAEAAVKVVMGEDVNEAYDTLKEISDWIGTHGQEATDLTTRVKANEDAITKLNDEATVEGSVAHTVKTAIDGALKADGKDKYALASELATTNTNVETANGKITALETKTAGLKNADGEDVTVKAYVDAGDNALDAKITAVDQKVGNLGALASKSEVAEADLASALKTKIDGKADKATTLAGYGITDAYTKSGADDAISGAIDALKLGTMAKESAADYSKTTVLNGNAETDTAESNTFAGVRKYADSKASSALTDAKTYADGLVGADSAIAGRVADLESKHATGKTVAQEVTAGIEALDLANTYAAKTHAHAMTDVTGLSDELAKYATTDSVQTIAEGLNTKIGSITGFDSMRAYVDDVTGAINSAANSAEAGVAAINTKIGAVPNDKTIVGMIADAKTEATYDDAEVKASIADNKAKIETLNGAETVDGSVKKTVKDAINEWANQVTEDNNTIDTFKELVDYAASHTAEYSTLAGEVQSNTDKIATLNGEGVGSVKKTVADAIDKIGIGEYAKTADIEAGYVAKEEGKSLVSDTEITKLGKLAGNEQANVIEAIKVAGADADLAITGKKVTIPYATEDTAGIVKISDEVGLNASNQLELKKVSTDLLFNGVNELILNGGEI